MAQMSRRQFIERSAAVGAGALLGESGADAQQSASGARVSRSPNEKLNIGIIGVANQGRYNLQNVRSENIVALCDVDDNYLAATIQEFPGATVYNDFRRMLEQKDVDAVVVATPDHIHAPATLIALETGRHVYCEKPLTHTVGEARKVIAAAHRSKLATQMGTQIHAGDNFRRVVELVQSGAIGQIAEVHVWVDSLYTGTGRPVEKPPVPPTLHWPLWLGPAPVRPYHPTYVPFWWRSWWDFGGGALADLACHHMDLPHWALNLREPLTIEAEGPPVKAENTPEWLIVRYEYPARAAMPPVKLTWYNTGKRTPYHAEGKLPNWGSVLFVGEKGMLLSDYNRHVLLPEKDFEGFQPPPQTIPASIGHHAEWIQACKTGAPTTCNFDYSGPLAQTVLLGNVAYRVGCKLEWDAVHHQITNCPEAEPFVNPRHRRGWKV